MRSPDIQRTFHLNEYRELSNIEKALKLVGDGHRDSRIAGLACDISRNSIRRGQSAVKCGHNFQVNVRLGLFSIEAKENIVFFLRQVRLEGNIVDYLEGKRMVIFSNFVFHSFVTNFCFYIFFYIRSVKRNGLILFLTI
jgi:hypothetical protein